VGEHVKEAAMARVGLRDIVSLGDRMAVMGLRRGPGQDQYLNSMEEIFAEADEEQRAMPRPWAVHDAGSGALVGFAMISDNIPQPMDDDLAGPYYLWKLLIDHRFQRRGYGTATLDASWTTCGPGPAPTCSTPAARTAPARRAGSISATASPTPAGSCGARTSSRSTSRREADWDRLDHLHRRKHAQITHICALQSMSMKGALATQNGGLVRSLLTTLRHNRGLTEHSQAAHRSITRPVGRR
jgi:GNAT superfamily N-acetyltransferase